VSPVCLDALAAVLPPRSGRSSDQVIPGGAGTAGTEVGLGQIQAVERQEFPPEEFASGENEESES